MEGFKKIKNLLHQKGSGTKAYNYENQNVNWGRPNSSVSSKYTLLLNKRNSQATLVPQNLN